ncbi:FecR domain-containing protein [Acetobacter sp. TBRC 12305]|uniref:FecR domain-containing protein n=1 Tax=Acetobacter garciniae TaxID=2817435 RepID=A0A939HLL1_9PROT|nr:FecR domain-containing protein [Acetobacter garciniae]MBO1323778.1 FecR domain-containing protein [Acetobacter garciniae]MBX0343467.1 FecR domain-containing protein [Acetobacter garciniae]
MSTQNRKADSAMLEAATWKIRLHENPHDAGLAAEFEAWRGLDARHDRAWRKMEQVWGATAMLADNTAPPDYPVGPLPAPPPHTVGGRALRLAACAIVPVLACLLAFAPPDFLLRWQADYYTTTGETRTIVLADGSSVVLAARSAIALRYSAKERGVALLAGEAFFRVAHDGARGFAVTAGGVTTRDIGTAFDVRMAGPHVAVAVREGVVSVSRTAADIPRRLNAGQQWTLDRQTGRVGSSQVDPDSVGSWQSGHLVLDGLTLSEAVDVLGRYYPGTVLTHGLGRDRTPIGGVYDLHRPLEALQALCAVHGGRLVSLPAGFVLALPGPAKP